MQRRTLEVFVTSDGREFIGEQLAAERHEFALQQRPQIDSFIAKIEDPRHKKRVETLLTQFVAHCANLAITAVDAAA